MGPSSKPSFSSVNALSTKGLYQESVYIIIDRDKVSDEIMATQGLKQGCPLSPLLYSLSP